MPHAVPSWRADLERDGFVVIPDVVSAAKAAEYTEKGLKWLESFELGFKRDDPSTWRQQHLPDKNQGGLVATHAVAHEDWVWEARQEPALLDKFEQLWGTDKLLVSFDAVNLSLPIGPHARADLEPTPPWPHIDQEPYPKDRPSLQLELVQGFLQCTPCGPEDGGLIVVKGSHNKMAQMLGKEGGIYKAEMDKGERNFYSFTASDVKAFEAQGCEVIKVCAPAGSLVLWESRLIHYNCPPTADQWRHVIYTCYAPKSWATEDAVERKKVAFAEWKRTSHWPHQTVVLDRDGRLPNGDRDPFYRTEPINKPVMTDKLLQLAGVKEY
ncbi:hypothetical protein JCM6882_005455 [Rhodosporidiobolus microsporus]